MFNTGGVHINPRCFDGVSAVSNGRTCLLQPMNLYYEPFCLLNSQFYHIHMCIKQGQTSSFIVIKH